MEYLVLDSYMNLKKQSKVKWKQALKTLDKNQLFSLIMILAIAVFSISSLFFDSISDTVSLIAVILEIVCVIFISRSIDKSDIENSATNIEKLDNEYEDVKLWLNNLGYVNKYQIMQLCNRCRLEIEKIKNQNIEKSRFVNKIICTCLIPVSLVLLSRLLELDNDIMNLISVVFSLSIIWITLYLALFGAIKIINKLRNHNYYKMCNMVRDIQGMLDRKYPISKEDIA